MKTAKQTNEANITVLGQACRVAESQLQVLNTLLENPDGAKALHQVMPYSADHIIFDVRQITKRLEEVSSAIRGKSA